MKRIALGFLIGYTVRSLLTFAAISLGEWRCYRDAGNRGRWVYVPDRAGAA